MAMRCPMFAPVTLDQVFEPSLFISSDTTGNPALPPPRLPKLAFAFSTTPPVSSGTVSK